MPALQIADRLGLPPLHAEQVGGARHVDIEEGAPHQEIARLGGDILRELGQPLRRDRARQAALAPAAHQVGHRARSEEHTSELQSLMRISYAVFCLKQKTNRTKASHNTNDSITAHIKYYNKLYI